MNDVLQVLKSVRFSFLMRQRVRGLGRVGGGDGARGRVVVGGGWRGGSVGQQKASNVALSCLHVKHPLSTGEPLKGLSREG